MQFTLFWQPNTAYLAGYAGHHNRDFLGTFE